MRRSVFVLFFSLVLACSRMHAQAIESAEARGLTITAGVFGSGFWSDAYGDRLLGPGTYVDVHFTHWFQIEAEARWLYWNQYAGHHQSHYLIGPRVPVKQFGRAQLYGKALIGVDRETFTYGYGYGQFTDLAFGGTLDYRLTRKLTLRAADFEYQYIPKWLNDKTLDPYGVSVGIGYRVF